MNTHQSLIGMRLFIGTGADGLKPAGYTTVDIDPANKPDIVADASNLTMIEADTCHEVYASHVLEHIPWPYVLSALAEWARVLKPGGVIKISVPDMELLARMLARGDNVWHVMANFYGGHWATPGGPQGHHYGYTRQMLVEVLSVLGFDDFDHWNSLFHEAANGWLYSQNGERLALSLNIAGTKKRAPLVDIPALVDRIRHREIMQPFMAVAGSAADRSIRARASWKCPNSATARPARAALSSIDSASAASSDIRKNAVSEP
jgi:predicted SAM-dependent methyltransferase